MTKYFDRSHKMLFPDTKLNGFHCIHYWSETKTALALPVLPVAKPDLNSLFNLFLSQRVLQVE